MINVTIITHILYDITQRLGEIFKPTRRMVDVARESGRLLNRISDSADIIGHVAGLHYGFTNRGAISTS